jgi:hypothetical protein
MIPGHQLQPNRSSVVNKAANTKRIYKGAERALRLRAELWPKVPESDLWSRHNNTGFTTIPRTLPHLMNLIDSLSKSQPAGRAYLTLWFRAFDQALIIVDSPAILAAESGFNGERAVTTWRQRMATLAEFGFIKAEKGPSGDFHYLLLMNPHKVVWKLKAKDQISRQLFLPLLDRATEIGAYDMSAPEEHDAEADGTADPFAEGNMAAAAAAAADKADDVGGDLFQVDQDQAPNKASKREDFPVIEAATAGSEKPAVMRPAAKPLPKRMKPPARKK